MKKGIVCFFLLIIPIEVACAGLEKGDVEIDMSFSWSQTQGVGGTTHWADQDRWKVSTAMGYFISRNLLIQTLFSGDWMDSKGVGTSASEVQYNLYSLGTKGKWHFLPDKEWTPYIGIQVLWGVLDYRVSYTASGLEAGPFDRNEQGWLLGPVGGVRYEFNETNDFYIEYQYLTYEQGLGDLLDDSQHVSIGLIHLYQ